MAASVSSGPSAPVRRTAEVSTFTRSSAVMTPFSRLPRQIVTLLEADPPKEGGHLLERGHARRLLRGLGCSPLPRPWPCTDLHPARPSKMPPSAVIATTMPASAIMLTSGACQF
jgi:hypothetical protein